MAGFKLDRKVKASTLVEVLVSIVIIMIIFSTAMAIYTNVLRSSVSFTQIRAQAALKQMMKAAEKFPVNTNQTLSQGDFKIRRQVSVYNKQSALKEIRLTAFNMSDEKLAELRKVVYDSQ